MADSLGSGRGAIGLAEDAVRLLRSASPATLLCHPVGSVPLALTLLMTWNTITDSHTSDARWALAALLPTIALVWMNCWRAVFAGRLRLELGGIARQPWSVARTVRLAAAQAFFAATKLLAMPVAALVLFPWAETIAFYRYLAVVGGSEDLGPRETMARARHVAGMDRRQGWAVLPILLFLAVAIGINLLAVLGLLPQLARILTGYDTAYSRSGIYFVLNPMFLLLVLALTWIVFDPFVQAVYTVAYFRAESRETGEDLRSGLRRLLAAGKAVAMLLVLLAAGVAARADVAPADLQKSIQRAMQAPEYDWRLPPAPVAANTPWIVRITDRLVNASRRVLDAIGNALDKLFRWLSDKLRNAMPTGPPGGAPAMGMSWVVAALIVIVVAAGAILWQKRRARGRSGSAAVAAGPVRLDAADLTPDLLPEERWIELAERSLAEENFRFALRAYYLACLAWLGRQELISIHPGKTNREYWLELRRRTRGIESAGSLFEKNVAAFERVWYGMHPVGVEDVVRFRERGEELKKMVAREVAA